MCTCLTAVEAVSSFISPVCSGWNKTSLSLDASEEHDGYSSAEDPLNSDPEDENAKKLVSRRRVARSNLIRGR